MCQATQIGWLEDATTRSSVAADLRPESRLFVTQVASIPFVGREVGRPYLSRIKEKTHA
jgi:hypothetical protein